jgi:hypothetical protein
LLHKVKISVLDSSAAPSMYSATDVGGNNETISFVSSGRDFQTNALFLPTASCFIVAFVTVCYFLIMNNKKTSNIAFSQHPLDDDTRQKVPLVSDVSELSLLQQQVTLERKQSFLKRSTDDCYGYASSRAGFIDDWRHYELPHRVSPIKTTTTSSRSDQSRRNEFQDGKKNNQIDVEQDDEEKEVYLDYAGSALPTQSQLLQCTTRHGGILANPHSNGPAASRTVRAIEETKKRILEHFQAQPGRRFSGIRKQQTKRIRKNDHTTESENNNSNDDDDDYHCGYEIIFTSGATEACRIVAERFPWSSSCSCCRSILAYPQAVHTSVISMREPALASGQATFVCKPSVEELLQEVINNNKTFSSTSDEKFTEPVDNKTTTTSNTAETNTTNEHENPSTIGVNQHDCSCGNETPKNLFVFPMECNFGGDCIRAREVIQKVQQQAQQQQQVQQWFTMLDIAKAASTGPVHLRRLNPDFACVSFYKLFGEPTGLGCLFIKRTAIDTFIMGETTTAANTSSRSSGSCGRSNNGNATTLYEVRVFIAIAVMLGIFESVVESDLIEDDDPGLLMCYACNVKYTGSFAVHIC